LFSDERAQSKCIASEYLRYKLGGGDRKVLCDFMTSYWFIFTFQQVIFMFSE